MENFDAIRQLVDAVASRNHIDATASFEGLMGGKIRGTLDAERQRLAASMFGGTPPVADNTDASDEGEATASTDVGAAE